MSGSPLAAPGGGEDFVVDPVEVLLPTTLSPLDLTTLLFGAVAVGSLVALLAAWLASWAQQRSAGRSQAPDPRWPLLMVSAVASTTQLILLLAPQATEGLATALTARQPATLLARLLLLGALALLLRAPVRPPLAAPALSGVLLATAALAAPGLAGVGDLLVGSGLGLVLLVAGAAALSTLGSRPVAHRLGVLAVVVAAAVPVVLAGLPEPAPPYHAERLVTDGMALDITVAPVEPGRNEFHLYAWDEDAAEVDLIRAEVHLDTPQGTQRFELARISPNHHLSYLLELTGPGPWPYRIEVLPADGAAVFVASTIEEVP